MGTWRPVRKWKKRRMGTEISTDVEVSHAICQNCRIVLVETNSPEFADLEAGEDTAVALGATEISNSWGGEEPTIDSAAFNHPGIVITAAAGDEGYLNWTEAKSGKKYYEGADYPACSPHVVAVGGTRLTLSGGVRQSETVWNDGEGAGGGGCSLKFTAQPWQQSVPDWSAVGCEDRRAVADVSADADPETGVAVYDSIPYPEEQKGKIVTTELGWVPIGGTSVASPIIASMFALAGGAHGSNTHLKRSTHASVRHHCTTSQKEATASATMNIQAAAGRSPRRSTVAKTR